MRIDRSEARSQLQEMLRSAQSLERELRSRRIYRSDEAKRVTALANGFGSLIQVEISEEGFRHPTKLGNWATSAIRRACQTGAALGEKLREKRYPNLFSVDDLQLPLSKEPVDMLAIGDAGSQRERNATAQFLEQLQRLAVAQDDFQKKRFRRRIGPGSGWVVCRMTGEVIGVSIDPSISNMTNRQRLASQIVAAVHEAQAYAERARDREIGELNEWGQPAHEA